jgi:hypothetical protein
MITNEGYTGQTYQQFRAGFERQVPVISHENTDSTDRIAALSFEKILNAPVTETPLRPANVAPVPTANSADFEGDGSVGGFMTVLKTIVDVINPLQHIPVISTLYRHMTGDEISAPARIAGDTLYGGALGAAISLADVAFEKSTGKDMGETAMALLFAPEDSSTKVASASTPTPLRLSDIIWDTPAPEMPGVQIASADPNFFPASLTTDFPTPATSAPTKPDRTGGTGNNQPAIHSSPALGPIAWSAITEEDTVSAPDRLTAVQADSTNVLPLQAAPAATARTAVPPGFIANDETFMMPAVPVTPVEKAAIAARMSEALDKYTALQRLPNSTTF